MRLDEATRVLGELISGQQEATQRLELLTQYRDEYHGRFLASARDGIGRDAWDNYRAFLDELTSPGARALTEAMVSRDLDRLDTAVAQAKEMVAASERRTASGQKEWLNKRGRVKAFDTLAQRHQSRVIHAEAKQEQKVFDEHAARKHGEKTSG